MLVCIVGRRHGDDDDNKPVVRYLGPAKGVKCLADVRAAEHISQVLDSEVYKTASEKMKEGGRERSVEVAMKQYKRSNTYRYETV